MCKNKASFIFDCIIASLLIIIAFLDAFIFKVTNNDYLTLEKISSIVITLLPSIITIVSISLSISKEKIYGATINEINSLRGSFYFNFMHMVLVMCISIGTYSLFATLNLVISIYFLEFISFVYSVIFAIQEIPLLLHSKRTITRILKGHYLTYKADNLFENQESDAFNKIISNIILTEGIDAAYKVIQEFKMKDDQMVDYALSLQNKFFWSVNENTAFEKITTSYDVEDIPIIDLIDTGYQNIENVCLDRVKYPISSVKYYQLTRTIFFLHTLCESLNLAKKEKARLLDLFSSFSLTSDESETSSLITSILIVMSCVTLNDGDVWFIKLLRDNNWGQIFLFDFNKRPIGIFLSMMISHLCCNSGLSKEDKDKLKLFIEEPDNGINASGRDWKSNLNTTLEFSTTDQIINSLTYFIQCYESVDEPNFYFHGKTKRLVYSCKEIFDKHEIFHDWLLMVFYASDFKSTFDEINLEPILSTLSDANKSILAEEISNNWLDFDCKEGSGVCLKKDIDTVFFNTFSIEMTPYFLNEKSKEKLINHLVKFHDEFYKNQNNKNHNSLEIDCCNKTKKLIDDFKGLMNKTQLFDENIDLSNAGKRYFDCLLPSDGIDIALRAYIESICRSVTLMISDDIKNQVKPTIGSRYGLTDENVKKILELKPNFCTFNYKISSYIVTNENEYSNKLKQLNIQSKGNLPLDLYWKGDAIKFNMQLDENYPMVRSLRDDELDLYISKNYQPFDNGLYRYNVYSNDKKNSFYVTKEELKEILKKSLLFVIIPFTYRCEIRAKDILYFERNKRD